ncbi:MAG TPA: hypothetical protein VFB34_06850 [Chloroflexota bacterium]|nr:hypothetical protein [Chloroflexota bacterium]
MNTVGGIVSEDIRNTIAIGQSVYDSDGKNIGDVDMIDRTSGYFTIYARPMAEKRDNPLLDRHFYVPFRLITNIDPRELYLSLSRDQLDQGYVNPPARSTTVEYVAGHEVAVTTEQSGYTNTPLVVDRVRIDELRHLIEVGDRVFTSELADLGTITKYDPVTGWMLVEQRQLSGRRHLMVPVTVVDYVNHASQEVYLVVSGADLQRLQHLEPVDVVFVEATEKDGK